MMKKTGFTLVEIMIVVAIIGLLASIAIPSFMKARNTSVQNACINNLRQVDAAKEQAAMAQKWPSGTDCEGDAANRAIVNAYIKDTEKNCPGDGTITYDYGILEENPSCTYSGMENSHILPL